MRKGKKTAGIIIALAIAVAIVLIAVLSPSTVEAVKSGITNALDIFFERDTKETETEAASVSVSTSAPEGFDLSSVPEWDGSTAYVILNGNIPFFTEEEKTCTDTFEHYSDLDILGRCGTAYANLNIELMPEEEREDISEVHPSGWNQAFYDGLVDGSALYNRCHLIAFMLAGENANEKNLITGTRFLNVDGMLPWETSVQEYVIANQDSHVLYRVTPVFKDNELVCRGVLIEAWSVEDSGGISICVYCYNEQPGIAIDHATGESSLA